MEEGIIVVSELDEGYAEKLVEARKYLGWIFGWIPLYAAAIRVKKQVRHELRHGKPDVLDLIH